MDNQTILSAVDHTLLAQTATWEEIRQTCDDGVAYGCASVCIPASYVRRAADYLGGKLPVCTVIGFPNGYSTTAVKVFEAQDAIANGAREIDMDQHRLGQGRSVGRAAGRDPGGQGRLWRTGAEGHRGDLPAHR